MFYQLTFTDFIHPLKIRYPKFSSNNRMLQKERTKFVFSSICSAAMVMMMIVVRGGVIIFFAMHKMQNGLSSAAKAL